MGTMKRKVIQIAESTQLISLPRKWALQYGIKKGDELDVDIQGSQLMISSGDSVRTEKIELDVSTLEPFILRAVDAMYKSGYDEVDLHFSDSHSIHGLQANVSQEMPEFEIIEQTGSSLKIRSVSTASAEELDGMLRRMFLITLSISQNVADMAAQANFQKIEDVLALEKTNNRLCNFCERLLNKYGFLQYRKPTFLYTIVWEMEKIADQYKYLCLGWRERMPKLSDQEVQLLQQTHQLLHTFYELFYKYDPDKAAAIATTRKQIIDRVNELFFKPNQDYKLLHHTASIAQMVFNLLGCYFGTRY